MNPSSFEYNTAIQQITGQEMGEAHKMIEVFESCYFLASHPSAWNWIGGTLICICLVLVAFGLFSLNKENNCF